MKKQMLMLTLLVSGISQLNAEKMDMMTGVTMLYNSQSRSYQSESKEVSSDDASVINNLYENINSQVKQYASNCTGFRMALTRLNILFNDRTNLKAAIVYAYFYGKNFKTESLSNQIFYIQDLALGTNGKGLTHIDPNDQTSQLQNVFPTN